MSIGDLIAQATAPQMALNKPLAGPQPDPTPNAPQGQGAPSPPSPALPPAQAYGPDPSTAASIAALMQMHAQDRRANGIDRGLAMMAGSFGPVETRAAIMNSAQPEDDRIAVMNEAMPIVMQQRMLANAPALGQALGMTPAVAASLPPDVLSKLLMAQSVSKIEIGQKMQEEKNTDLQDAIQKTPQQLISMDDMETRLNDIKTATENDTPVLQSILDSPAKRAAAKELMGAKEGETGFAQLLDSAWASVLTPREKSIVAQLKQLSSQSYGDAFEKTGSRRTGQEVANLRAGLNQITSLNQPYDTYVKQLDNYQLQLQKGKANALGAAQRLDEVPDALKPLVDKPYLPGGASYAGHGGEWASKLPPPGQTTVAAAPAPAVTYLKSHPELAAQFDAKYGPGASKAALGQ